LATAKSPPSDVAAIIGRTIFKTCAPDRVRHELFVEDTKLPQRAVDWNAGEDSANLAFDLDHFLHPEESFSEDVVSAVDVRERQPASVAERRSITTIQASPHKKRSKRMEPFVFTLPAEIDVDTCFERKGEKFILVLRARNSKPSTTAS
jgi:hypothetical protein